MPNKVALDADKNLSMTTTETSTSATVSRADCDANENSNSNSNGFATSRSRLAEVGHQLRVVLPQTLAPPAKNVSSLTTPTIVPTSNLPLVVGTGTSASGGSVASDISLSNPLNSASSSASSSATSVATSSSSSSSSSSSAASSAASSLVSLASRASMAAAAAAAAACSLGGATGATPSSASLAPNSAVTNQIINSLVQLNSPENCRFTGLPSCTPASADRLTKSVVNPFFWGVSAFNNGNSNQANNNGTGQSMKLAEINSTQLELTTTHATATTTTTTTSINAAPKVSVTTTTTPNESMAAAAAAKAQVEQRQRLASLSLQQAQNIAILSPFPYWLSPEHEAWLRLGMSPTQNPIAAAMNQYHHQQQQQQQQPHSQQQQVFYANNFSHGPHHQTQTAATPQDLTQTYLSSNQQQHYQNQASVATTTTVAQQPIGGYGLVTSSMTQVDQNNKQSQISQQNQAQCHLGSLKGPILFDQTNTQNPIYQTARSGPQNRNGYSCSTQPTLDQMNNGQQQVSNEQHQNGPIYNVVVSTHQPTCSTIPPPIAHHNNQQQYQVNNTNIVAVQTPLRLMPLNEINQASGMVERQVSEPIGASNLNEPQSSKPLNVEPPTHSSAKTQKLSARTSNSPQQQIAEISLKTGMSQQPVVVCNNSCCSSATNSRAGSTALLEIDSSPVASNGIAQQPATTTSAIPTTSNGLETTRPVNAIGLSNGTQVQCVPNLAERDQNQPTVFSSSPPATLTALSQNISPTGNVLSATLNTHEPNQAATTGGAKRQYEVRNQSNNNNAKVASCNSSKKINSNRSSTTVTQRPYSNKAALTSSNRSMTTTPAATTNTTIDANGVEVVKKKSKGGRKKKIVTHDELLARKNRSKERNRVAAKRCRQKRKQFLDELRDRIDNLNDLNSRLMKENSLLKSELDLLKRHHSACGSV